MTRHKKKEDLSPSTCSSAGTSTGASDCATACASAGATDGPDACHSADRPDATPPAVATPEAEPAGAKRDPQSESSAAVAAPAPASAGAEGRTIGGARSSGGVLTRALASLSAGWLALGRGLGRGLGGRGLAGLAAAGGLAGAAGLAVWLRRRTLLR